MTSANESGYHLSTSLNFTPLSRFRDMLDAVQLYSKDYFFLPEREKEIVRTSSSYDAKKLGAIKNFSLADMMSLEKLKLPNAEIGWEVKPLIEVSPNAVPVSFYRSQIDKVLKSYESLPKKYKDRRGSISPIEAGDFCRECEEALKNKVQ